MSRLFVSCSPASRGHACESGRWTSDGAANSDGVHGNIILVSNGPGENEKERVYNERRKRGEESPKEDFDHGRGSRSFPSLLCRQCLQPRRHWFLKTYSFQRSTRTNYIISLRSLAAIWTLWSLTSVRRDRHLKQSEMRHKRP